MGSTATEPETRTSLRESMEAMPCRILAADRPARLLEPKLCLRLDDRL